ncbi:hypothetical protein ACIQMZ_36265 [Streptomyces longwoodensis]|uniref:hypothetical protein n=1 Tax=Streptomyces longwoodensis TaxID=68231 RepID=UPI00380EFDF3
MATETPFGVGCIAPEVIGAKSLEQWERAVTETLKSIPSIHNFEIQEVKGFFALPPSDTRNTFEKMPNSGMLKFRVAIPLRVQEDLAPGKSLAGVEEFTVRTYFDRRHPVTFVVCEGDASEVVNPSYSLMIIREFLKVEIGKLKRDDVRLHRMGPTPFHGDFFLREGAAGSQITDGLHVDVTQRRGYDDFHFEYDPQKLDHEKALWRVFWWMKSEFAVFYYVNSTSIHRMSRAYGTIEVAQELAETYAQTGILSYLRRVFRNKSTLLALRLSLIEAKLYGINARRDVEEMVSLLYAERSVQVLKPYIDRTKEEAFEEEAEAAEKTLDVLESQHTLEVQRLTTFCASLLGVVVGAFLTAWLRK